MQTRPWQWPDFPDASPYGLEQYLLAFLLFVGLPLLCCYVLYRFYAKRRETARPPREVHVLRETVLVVCPYCSARAEQGASFCPRCGGRL